MEKLMPLDILSSIKGAESSEAVDKLFSVIKKAAMDGASSDDIGVDPAVATIEQLRADNIESCAEEIKELIRKNFPNEKDGYLVVPKVIED